MDLTGYLVEQTWFVECSVVGSSLQLFVESFLQACWAFPSAVNSNFISDSDDAKNNHVILQVKQRNTWGWWYLTDNWVTATP